MYLLLIVLIILIIYIYIFKFANEEKQILANDGNYYTIRNINENEKESVEVLSRINKRISVLLDYITKKHSNVFWIKKLNDKYDRKGSSISEAAVQNGNTSFIIDKNFIHICLRTRNSEKRIYDINTLMYVVLHELAHMGNYDENDYPIEGHGKEFQEKFKILINEAINTNIYYYEDYSRTPREYCGIMIYKNI